MCPFHIWNTCLSNSPESLWPLRPSAPQVASAEKAFLMSPRLDPSISARRILDFRDDMDEAMEASRESMIYTLVVCLWFFDVACACRLVGPLFSWRW